MKTLSFCPASNTPEDLNEGWNKAEIGKIDFFHPRSSAHRPATIVRGIYDREHLHVRFDVRDRFVRCLNTEYQSLVSGDTCVEFFVEPQRGKGYFNFEMNCGGALLLYYIEDPTRMPDRLFRKYSQVPPELGRQVQIAHSLPRVVDPEIVEPVDWWLSVRIPRSLFAHYVGPVDCEPGVKWRGNFFKCASESSHPHWGCWSPIGEQLRFHQPEYFGELLFGA